MEEKIRPGYAALARGEVLEIVTGKPAKTKKARRVKSIDGHVGG